MMDKQRGLYQKARKYDVISNYFKYSDPQKHIYYYKKHLKYMYRALQMEREFNKNDGSVIASYLRFFHAALQVEKIDIYINGKKIFQNLEFKKKTNYITLPAGKYHVDIYPAGNQTSTIITKKIDLLPNQYSTFSTIGNNDQYRLLSFIDESTIESPITRVRFIHLNPKNPPVNVSIVQGETLFKNIAYKEATNYHTLTPMTVNLEIKETETGNILETFPNQTFLPNQVHSLIYIDRALSII